ncbi:MAG: CHC2 zinc finger domain-containing protein [Pseudomonadota bacterium]
MFKAMDMEEPKMGQSKLLDFTAIRRDTDFATVLSYYGLLPAAGVSQPQLKLNCPFHDDASPSCSVNLEKGIFKCFGCSAQGNVLDFIAQMEELGDQATFKASQKALAIMSLNADEYRKGRAPAARPQNRRSDGQTAETAETPGAAQKTPTGAILGSPGDVVAPTENPVLELELTLNPEHEFLAARAVDPEIAAAFGLGYCKAGIMKGRIAIPIHNHRGELVAYTGRWAGPKETIPEKTGKYKLPKGFHKELELFNLHRAAALGHPYVVVVEGVWSTIRLHRAGIPAVALLGTSLSEHQAKLIASAGFRHAVLILDGDEAGRQARPGVLSVLSQHVYVRSLELEDGVKPDTMDDELVNRLRR